MAITKDKVLDQIILEPKTGTVLWRETTVIVEDGVELSRSYHRGSAMVDEPDSARIPAEVKTFRTMIDTPAARAKAQEARDKNDPTKKAK